MCCCCCCFYSPFNIEKRLKPFDSRQRQQHGRHSISPLSFIKHRIYDLWSEHGRWNPKFQRRFQFYSNIQYSDYSEPFTLTYKENNTPFQFQEYLMSSIFNCFKMRKERKKCGTRTVMQFGPQMRFQWLNFDNIPFIDILHILILNFRVPHMLMNFQLCSFLNIHINVTSIE